MKLPVSDSFFNKGSSLQLFSRTPEDDFYFIETFHHTGIIRKSK